MAPSFPPIYLLKTHFERRLDKLHELELQIGVVFNIGEAELVIGEVNSKTRAIAELRWLGVITEEVERDEKVGVGGNVQGRERKRQKIGKNADGKDVITIDSGSETEEDFDMEESRPQTLVNHPTASPHGISTGGSAKSAGLRGNGRGDTVKVLRLAWYMDSVEKGELLPVDNYLVYEGRIISKSKGHAPVKNPSSSSSIIARAKADRAVDHNPTYVHKGGRSQSEKSQSITRPTHLLHETTSEHDIVADLPPIPEYLQSKWSCERPTPLHCPNEEFISQLKIIKQQRILAGDEENGHVHSPRAYSAAISTLASYPYKLASVSELQQLPYCKGPRLMTLYKEWKDTGRNKEVDEILEDERFKVLNIFQEIFDVGPNTAREFYDKGWRDLDDVVNYGWNSLYQGQKIGVKFYEEFQESIPRPEVERIANYVLEAANKLEPGFHMVICGGYRRGKLDSGDVDIVLSHPDQSVTENLIGDLLYALETDGSITHTLKFTDKNSRRGQEPVAWKGNKKAGSGFDTLDHMFVAWQDQEWPTKEADLAKNPKFKNPNIHRRVDIIISPWKTAGCAVIGWSGATMFQRDLRAYCRKKLGFKFDSSGVRRVDNGDWVNLEDGGRDLEEKERLVFERLGLEWREPWERCTD